LVLPHNVGSACASVVWPLFMEVCNGHEVHAQHKLEPWIGNVLPNSPLSVAAAAPLISPESILVGYSNLTAFAKLRPASSEPGSPTLRSNKISASPSHHSQYTDPNLHMLCLVCNNALGTGGNNFAYYSCSGSSAGHGHSTVCVPCFSSPKARLTECLVRMAVR